MTERVVVPDGEPCPKHGLPTRLLYGQGLGLFSQCQGCIEDFLDWFASHTRHVRPAITTPAEISTSLTLAPPRDQLELLS